MTSILQDITRIAGALPHLYYCPLDPRFESSLPQWQSLFKCTCIDERIAMARAAALQGGLVEYFRGKPPDPDPIVSPPTGGVATVALRHLGSPVAGQSQVEPGD